MYLKRLEIQGFKSFAGKNVFEFGPGITAVVGPNGSGKSNLADALRWALGEQNPRTLRSRKAEEVIFAGDRRRPPAGLAEVSLALDNSDGWLPVEFEEVVFTRRLHRSGDSEYLVNRTRVRLKDMTDLLSRARVGQNSYAIMGQGLVDQVLNLRPEDRRALIEEAADVRSHRLKITDAVDRLNTTRDNLDRVDLLVGEIAPRLAQLEAQAQRAAEAGAFTEQLADALQALFALQWSERTAALAEARGRYEERMNALVTAQGEVERLGAELAQLRAALGTEREGAGRSEAGVRDLDDRVRRAEQRLQLLGERREMLTQRVAEIAADTEALRRERDELAAAGQADVEDQADAGEDDDDAVSRREAELRRAQAEQEAALRVLTAAEDGLRQVRGQSAGYDDRIDRLQRDQRTLAREREDGAGRRNGLLARLRKHGGDTLRLVRELARIEAEIGGRAGDQSTARRQAATARQSAEHAVQALAELAAELDAARTRMEMLGRLRDDQQGSDAAVRALVEAARRAGADRPPRLIALLSQVIRVQKGLEQAIEAALGDQLGAVLVNEGVDAQAALDVLAGKNLGRATIVPLRDLKPAHAVNLSGERGVLGVAARLVKCDGRYRELVDTLLGRVIVVEDAMTAQAMLRRGLGTVVTLDGTLFRPTGIISAGSGGAGGLVLAYQQELDELPERVAALRAAHAARAEDAAHAREHARAAEARQRDLDARLEELQGRRRRLLHDLAASKSAIAGLRGEAGWLRGSDAAFTERRELLARDLAAATEERRRLTQSLRAAQLEVEEARRESERLRAPLNELRAQAAAAQGARQALAQQRAALARLRDGRRAALERTDRAIATRAADAAARQSEIAAVVAEQRGLEAELTGSRSALAEARATLQPRRERVATLAREERELFERHTTRRTELLTLERASMDAEAAVNRRAQAIDRLREEMEAEGLEAPQEAPAPDAVAAAVLAAHALGVQTALGETTVAIEQAPATIEALAARVRTLRARIRGLGPINAQAQMDFREAQERHGFLTTQVADLRVAEADLQQALEELRRVVRERFRETFHAVNADFARYFKTFFGGGTARLALTEPEDYGESGVDILAQPPGKRQQHLQLLSGGERAMAAVALLFALLETNPAPFCVLDEVDAALDEANVGRFGETLRQLADRTQFVLITHNRNTLQVADAIYGVSMSGDGVSSVLSLKLEEQTAGAPIS